MLGRFTLHKVGRGEVDDDAAVHGPAETAVADGGAHPFAGFLDGGIREADD
jgi:hypothetical protein